MPPELLFPEALEIADRLLAGGSVTLAEWLPIWRAAETLADTEAEQEYVEKIHRLVIGQE